MKLLLQGGAKPNLYDKYPPLCNAIKHDKDKSIVALISHPKTDLNLKSPLQKAVNCSSMKYIEWLLKKKSDINSRNEGITALEAAITENKDDIACKLIIMGAKVGIGHTIHRAIRSKNDDILKILIKNGANVNKWDQFKITPIHQSVILHNHNALKILLDAKADPNKDNDNHYHILGETCKLGDEVALDLLLAAKADINNDESGGLSETPLFNATNNYTIAKKLIDLRANVNAKTEFGKTPMFYAVLSRNKQVINLLITSKADVNVISNRRITLPYLAVQQKDLGILKQLIEIKADTTIACSIDGLTPLKLAMKYKYTDCSMALMRNQVEKEIKCKMKAIGEACPICMEPMGEQMVVTQCFHIFHEKCWKMYLSKRDENKNICPMCRGKP
jgi:ankyrin repeat protein